MERRDRIINLYFKSIKQFNEIESQPRDFGTGDLLYSSEIHTLEAVGKYPDSNLTALSDRLSITKGGAAKFLKKLQAKELVVKERMPGNRKETLYRLTPKGEIAFQGHKAYSEKMFGEIFKRLEALSNDEAKLIETFLEGLNDAIKRH
jgi:DNA-binding MarR family transcriptional regulator